MKPLPRLLLTSLLFAATGSAMAASSVDLAVTGKITPNACTPSISSGGVVDHGKISAKDLKVDKGTDLDPVTLKFDLACTAATLVAVKGEDNRTGSSAEIGEFGLGMTPNNEKLGSTYFVFTNVVADGAAARSISSSDNGLTWRNSGRMLPDYLMSVANTTTLAPMPLQAFNADLTFFTLIAPANTLTLDKELDIDGSVTLKVFYL